MRVEFANSSVRESEAAIIPLPDMSSQATFSMDANFLQSSIKSLAYISSRELTQESSLHPESACLRTSSYAAVQLIPIWRDFSMSFILDLSRSQACWYGKKNASILHKV